MFGPQHDTPAGFTRTAGKRNPPANSGPYYVMLRNGMLPPEPWPAGRTISGQTRWKWEWNDDGSYTPHDFDIVAVRKA
jgi:hypothetical protein